MEQNGNQNLPPTTLCRTGCGFYGNAAFDGMCSKCYKDALKRKNNSSSPVSGGRVSPAGETTISEVGSMSVSLAQTTLGSSAVTSQDCPSSTPQSVLSASSSSSSTTPSIETATPTVPVPASSQEKDVEKTDEGAAGGSEVGDDSKSEDEKDKKPKKNRCHTCKKKVGLTGFKCRCGGLYCSLHRYSDKHDCNFNYKELAQQQIRKNNPVVVGKKIQKI